MLVTRLRVSCRALTCTALLTVAAPLAAETPPALPAWPDQASVYVARPSAPQPAVAAPTVEPSQPPVQLASAELPAPASRDPRVLAPPSDRHQALGPRDRPRDAASLVADFAPAGDSLYTTLSALAVVVGLFLLCAWAVRRGSRKANLTLPDGVVSVLGRVPLAARQFAELLRVGNKLVLVSVTPAGAETLTEVTDPVEIDRLLGLCQQRHSRSSTAEFDQVFRQLSEETAPSGLIDADRQPSELQPSDDPFAAYRGVFGRA